MSMLAELVELVIGVDNSHTDTHSAAVLRSTVARCGRTHDAVATGSTVGALRSRVSTRSAAVESVRVHGRKITR